MDVVAALNREGQLGSVLQHSGVTLGDGELYLEFLGVGQCGNACAGRCVGAYAYLTQADDSVKRGFELGLVKFGFALFYIGLEFVEVGLGLLVCLLTYGLLLVERFLAGQAVLG